MNYKTWKEKVWLQWTDHWGKLYAQHEKDFPWKDRNVWKDAEAEGRAKWELIHREYDKQFKDDWDTSSVKIPDPLINTKNIRWKAEKRKMEKDDLYMAQDPTHNPEDAVHNPNKRIGVLEHSGPKKVGLFYFNERRKQMEEHKATKFTETSTHISDALNKDVKKAPFKEPKNSWGEHAQYVARQTAKSIGEAKLTWMKNRYAENYYPNKKVAVLEHDAWVPRAAGLEKDTCEHEFVTRGLAEREYTVCMYCKASPKKEWARCGPTKSELSPLASLSSELSPVLTYRVKEALRQLDQDLQMLWIDQSLLRDRLESAQPHIYTQDRRRKSILRRIDTLKQAIYNST